MSEQALTDAKSKQEIDQSLEKKRKQPLSVRWKEFSLRLDQFILSHWLSTPEFRTRYKSPIDQRVKDAMTTFDTLKSATISNDAKSRIRPYIEWHERLMAELEVWSRIPIALFTVAPVSVISYLILSRLTNFLYPPVAGDFHFSFTWLTVLAFLVISANIIFHQTVLTYLTNFFERFPNRVKFRGWLMIQFSLLILYSSISLYK